MTNYIFAQIFKKHGFPDNIVLDRDPKFISGFQKRLMQLSGIKQKILFSRHSQIDGFSDSMNHLIEN